MENRGLITHQRRGRKIHILPTDKAWEWASGNLGATISKSPYASVALAALLNILQVRLNQTEMTLAQFVNFARGTDSTSLRVEMDRGMDQVELRTAPKEIEPDLSQRVRQAYLAVSGGVSNTRVRLLDMVKHLRDVPKSMLDEHLVAMQRTGQFGLVLWSLDDPRDITSEDDQAAVSVSGIKRHIVYMEA